MNPLLQPTVPQNQVACHAKMGDSMTGGSQLLHAQNFGDSGTGQLQRSHPQHLENSVTLALDLRAVIQPVQQVILTDSDFASQVERIFQNAMMNLPDKVARILEEYVRRS